MVRNLRYKIDGVSLQLEGKLIFPLFYFVFEGNFRVTYISPVGLIQGRAYFRILQYVDHMNV